MKANPGIFTRRQLLKYGAGAGVALYIPWELGTREAIAAALTGPTLPGTAIPKYEQPLIIPPAMPTAPAPSNVGGVEYYEIAVRQFEQQILPPGGPSTPADDGVELWLGRCAGNRLRGRQLPLPGVHDRGEVRGARPGQVDQRPGRRGRQLPPAPAPNRPDPALGQSPWGTPGPGWARHGSGSLHGPGSDRHPPARRAFDRGERRVRRGLVSAQGEEHPGRVRAGGVLLPEVQGKGPGCSRAGVDARQRRLRVRQCPEGGDDLVPRPHAGDDAEQRLRRPGRLLPPPRRPR